jgi:aminoglycoside 6'-N-acetyltransferase I
MEGSTFSVRLAVPDDLPGILALCRALWPDEPAEEVEPHMAATLGGVPWSTLPLVVFVAEVGREIVGFVEVGLRSHAEGCDTRRAVGFVEGWFVRPEHRRHGIGSALIRWAEVWSRGQGAVEIASDTWIDHTLSIDAHRALGFEVAERAIHFRKALG